MRTVLRPARPEDVEYCATLYFAGMEKIIEELNLDRSRQLASFHDRWEVTQVRIITLDGADIGWLQTTTSEGALFLGQLFVEAAFQRQGIGTEVMKHLIDEATRACQAVTLGVVKTNPALRLYRRLGFRITYDDDRKFYMRREPGTAAPISSTLINVRQMRSEEARAFLQIHTRLCARLPRKTTRRP